MNGRAKILRQVYRFEIVEERYRSASTSVLLARDLAGGSFRTLCQWIPDSAAFSAGAARFSEAASGLTEIEVFSSGESLYLAAANDAEAAAALRKLRATGLFTGPWVGLIPDEPPPTEPIRVKPPAPRWRILALVAGALVLIAVIAVGITMKRGSQPAPVTPIHLAQATQSPGPSNPAPVQPANPAPALQTPAEPPKPAEPPPEAHEPSPVPKTIQDGVLQVLNQWRDSMLSGNLDVQTECYAPTVEIFFRRKNLDRETLREMKRSGMLKWANVDQYQLTDLTLESATDNRVAITFRKAWDSWDSAHVKHFAGEEKQRLTFLNLPEGWKIVREEELEIYWVKRE